MVRSFRYAKKCEITASPEYIQEMAGGWGVRLLATTYIGVRTRIAFWRTFTPAIWVHVRMCQIFGTSCTQSWAGIDGPCSILLTETLPQAPLPSPQVNLDNAQGPIVCRPHACYSDRTMPGYRYIACFKLPHAGVPVSGKLPPHYRY